MTAEPNGAAEMVQGGVEMGTRGRRAWKLVFAGVTCVLLLAGVLELRTASGLAPHELDFVEAVLARAAGVEALVHVAGYVWFSCLAGVFLFGRGGPAGRGVRTDVHSSEEAVHMSRALAYAFLPAGFYVAIWALLGFGVLAYRAAMGWSALNSLLAIAVGTGVVIAAVVSLARRKDERSARSHRFALLLGCANASFGIAYIGWCFVVAVNV